MLHQANLSTTHRKALIEVTALPCPSQDDYRVIRRCTTDLGVLGDAAKPLWQQRLLSWLVKWRWADQPQLPEQRITWLELLIGFELDMTTIFPDAVHTDGYAPGPLRAQLGIGTITKHFRAATLKLLEAHFTQDVKLLFRSPHGEDSRKRQRLASIGITGSWAATSTHPNWPACLAEDVLSHLLKQRGVGPRLDTGLAQGPMLIKPKPLNRKHVPFWRSSLPQSDTDHIHTKAADTNTWMHDYQAMCQHCGASTIFLDKPASRGRKADVIKCVACKRRLVVSAMKCPTCLSSVGTCPCHIVGPAPKRQTTLSERWQQQGPSQT